MAVTLHVDRGCCGYYSIEWNTVPGKELIFVVENYVKYPYYLHSPARP
jgi:hypothetical protein